MKMNEYDIERLLVKVQYFLCRIGLAASRCWASFGFSRE